MLYNLPSDKNYCNNYSNELCLALKPPKNLSLKNLYIYLRNLIPFYLISVIFQKKINSKYYDIYYLPILKEFLDKSSIFHFYLNTCSLLNKLNELLQNDVSLPNHSYELSPTEANAKGTLTFKESSTLKN